MFYLMAVNSQNKHAANSKVQKLHLIITVLFFAGEFIFSRLIVSYKRKKCCSVSFLRSRTVVFILMSTLTHSVSYM